MLYKRQGGRLLVVPKPWTQDGLVKRLSGELGHFEVKRVVSMLQRDYR